MLDPSGRVLGGRTDDVLAYGDREVLSEEGLDAVVALLVRVVERRLSEVILLVEVGAGTVLEEQTNDMPSVFFLGFKMWVVCLLVSYRTLAHRKANSQIWPLKSSTSRQHPTQQQQCIFAVLLH